MTLVYLGLIRSEISVNINEPLNCDMLNDTPTTSTTPPPRHTLDYTASHLHTFFQEERMMPIFKIYKHEKSYALRNQG